MAIDFSDLTALDHMYHYVYDQGITNQFPKEQVTWNQFPKSDVKPGGLGFETSIKYAQPQGVGGRKESEKLPDPLASKGDKALIKPVYLYGTIRLTGPAIAHGKNSKMAFVNSRAEELDGIYQSCLTQLNRQCWGDGFGLLATLSEVSDALTTSATTWTVTCDNDRGVLLVKEGMLVDFFQSTAVDQSSIASRVSSVDIVNKVIEMEYNDGTYKTNHPITAMQSYTIATDTVASGSLMVTMGSREATHATSNVAREMTGLEGIFDDGTLLSTFENIVVATYPRWKATILSNSDVNRPLTTELMMQACDAARLFSDGRTSVMRMGLGQRRAYATYLLPDVRFEPKRLTGGYETLTFAAGDGSVDIVVDPVAPPNKVFCHPQGVIEKYELETLGFGDIDPGLKQRSGYDEYDRFLRIYANLGVKQRNCCVLIKDLTEPAQFSG